MDLYRLITSTTAAWIWFIAGQCLDFNFHGQSVVLFLRKLHGVIYIFIIVAVLHLFLLGLSCSGKLKLLWELIKPNHLFCLLFVSDIACGTWKVDDVWGLKVLIKIMLEAYIAFLGTIIMCIFVAWKVVLSLWLN